MATNSGGGAGYGGENRYIESRLTDISREVALSAEKHAQAAVILERLSNRLDATVGRVERLEEQPPRTLATIAQMGGCSSQIIYAALSTFSILLSMASLLYVVFHK